MDCKSSSTLPSNNKVSYQVYNSSKNTYVVYLEGKYIYTSKPVPFAPYLTMPKYEDVFIDPTRFQSFDFFIQQGLVSKWFGDVEILKTNHRFHCGDLVFATSPLIKGDLVYANHGPFELLRWKYNDLTYQNTLTPVDYYEFVKLIETIPEFKNESYLSELSLVDAMQGVFLTLEDQGIACIQMIGKEFFYVSYLGVIPTSRKKGVSKRLLTGLFQVANVLKKDIVVAVSEDKISAFYVQNGFVHCGYWNEVK